MPDESKSSAQETARHLMFISGYVHRLLRYEAKKLGLRWTALMVLKDLQLLGPVSQRVLADIEQVSAPTMTVLIRQMESRGWVRQKDDANDARVSQVMLTPAGKKELRRSGGLLRQRLENELSDVPARVLARLQEDLGVLSATIMKRIHGNTELKELT